MGQQCHALPTRPDAAVTKVCCDAVTMLDVDDTLDIALLPWYRIGTTYIVQETIDSIRRDVFLSLMIF